MNHRLLATAAALLLPLWLAACAGAPKTSSVVDAAASPLNDLNLVKAVIPPVLTEARQQPYALSADASCPLLAEQVKALDEALGPDLDAPADSNNPGAIERGTAAVGNAAVGALKGAAEGVVPFRGWVRKLSGAERHSKDVAAAIAAGTHRRSFLKGVRFAKGCVSPA